MSEQPLNQHAIQEEENSLILQRKEKLAAERARGNVFPNDFRRDSLSSELAATFAETTREEIEALPFAFTSMDDVLFWAASVMRESPTANSLLARAADREWSVVMNDLHNGGFYLDVPGKTLHLDHHSMKPSALGRSVYFRNAVLTTFIRALRDIWHEEAGRIFEEEFKPEDALLLERVRAADCDTVAILAGWFTTEIGRPKM